MNRLGQRAINQYQGNLIQLRMEQRAAGQWPLEGSAVIPIFHDKLTGSEANQHMSGNGSNHRVELFIEYLYLHVTVENIPERINGRSECAPGPGFRGGSTEVRTTEGSSAP